MTTTTLTQQKGTTIQVGIYKLIADETGVLVINTKRNIGRVGVVFDNSIRHEHNRFPYFLTTKIRELFFGQAPKVKAKLTSKQRLQNKTALINLYNAINSDHSIQRYTLTHSDVTSAIKKRFKLNTISTAYVSFENKVLGDDINACTGDLKETLITFAMELKMNVETFNGGTNPAKR